MAEIVKVTQLKKSFGRFESLKDVSFTVYSGKVVGFLG
ncbi:ABC transporter, partial [Enterococcus faecium]